MFSLRTGLRAARSPVAEGSISFMRDVQAKWWQGTARSLRESVSRMMIDPGMAAWGVANEGKFENHEWQEHCQGVACDGTAWYISRDDVDFGRKIVKFSLDFKHELARWDPRQTFGTHLGDIDVGTYKGAPCIYAPFEGDAAKGRVAVLTPQLTLITEGYLQGAGGGAPPTGPKAPWVGFNPGNRLIYTSVFDEARRLEAYDPEHGFRHIPEESITLDRTIRGVQGGAFNRSGHVFVSQEAVAAIWGFSTFTGAHLGSVAFEMHRGGLDQEFAEGLCWMPIPCAGVRCGLHFTLLDRDAGPDDMFLKHFSTGTID